jgi:hypothetical protein
MCYLCLRLLKVTKPYRVDFASRLKRGYSQIVLVVVRAVVAARMVTNGCDGAQRVTRSALPAHACFSAGNLAHLPGTIDAADGHAFGVAVPGDIEIRSFA